MARTAEVPSLRMGRSPVAWPSRSVVQVGADSVPSDFTRLYTEALRPLS
jgi:hypothetical protein